MTYIAKLYKKIITLPQFQLIVLLYIMALLPRLVLALFLQPHLQSGAIYLDFGWKLITGQSDTAMIPPLYSLMVMPVYLLFGEACFREVAVLQAIVYSILPPLVYFLAKEMLTPFRNESTSIAFIASLGACIYPFFVYNAIQIVETGLTVLTITAVLWSYFRWRNNKSIKNAILIGVMFGIALLNRANVLSVILPLPLLLLLDKNSFAQSLKNTAIIWLTIGCFAVPWMTRNYIEQGVFKMSTLAGYSWAFSNNDYGYELYKAGNGEALEQGFIPSELTTVQDADRYSEAQIDSILTKRGQTWIQQNPSKFIELAWYKFLNVWLPYKTDFITENVQQPWYKTAMYNTSVPLLYILAIVGALFLFQQHQSRLIVIFLYFAAFYTGPLFVFFNAYKRYRLPIDVLLAIFAAIGLWYILQKFKKNYN